MLYSCCHRSDVFVLYTSWNVYIEKKPMTFVLSGKISVCILTADQWKYVLRLLQQYVILWHWDREVKFNGYLKILFCSQN